MGRKKSQNKVKGIVRALLNEIASSSPRPDAQSEARLEAIAKQSSKKGTLLAEIADLKVQLRDKEQVVDDLRAKLDRSRNGAFRTLSGIIARNRIEIAARVRQDQQHARVLAEMGDAVAYSTNVMEGAASKAGKWGLLRRVLGGKRENVVSKANLTELVTWGDQANARGEWEDATTYYAAALRRDPSLVAIWVQLGHASKEQGLLGLAEASYRRATMRGPTSVDALVQLGHFLKKLDRHEEAHELFKKAAALDPDHAGLEKEDSATVDLALHTAPGEDLTAIVASIFDDAGSAAPGGGLLPANLSNTAASGRGSSAMNSTWPPSAVGGYWLPQTMRDYLIDRVGEKSIPLYQYLSSVIDFYQSDRHTFDSSADLEILVERAKILAHRHASDAPEASIIIPVYNNIVYTLTSVVSLLETAGDVSFEIIIGDDQSSDATPLVVQSIGGAVRLARHPKNIGFLFNCNETAKLARGRFLVILNNDTFLFPGWLDELILPLRTDDSIGMTGSKLLNSDGSLQEAGGIYWRDGSAWNFGRNQDPRLPDFNYVKETDYVSGASFAIPTALWRELAGFDAHYAPAYCEDADLAFRVRKKGLKVVYVPHSELIHHEGASHGRDTQSGIKAYQVVNLKKLRERWKDVLEENHFENGTHVIEARDRSRSKPHILVIDHYVPEWDRDAGSRSMLLYVKLFLDAGFQVAFWPDNLHATQPYTRELQKLGVEVVYSGIFQDRFPDWFAARATVFDYVFLSRPHIAQKYLGVLKKFPGVKTLYYGHDLHFMRMQREMALTPALVSGVEIERMRHLELEVCMHCDVVFYPNLEEVNYVRSQMPQSTIVDLISVYLFHSSQLEAAARRIQDLPARLPRELLFVGGFSHTPNRDGILWFINEVMPLLRARNSQVRLHIVGSNTPESIRTFAGPDIVVHGQVSDEELARRYVQAGLAIAPLRYGGGMKGKVLEAMATGIPLVTTYVGAQGIEDVEEVAYVADSAAAFADEIEVALSDAQGARERARRALDFIHEHHSARAALERLARHVPHLLASSATLDATGERVKTL